MRKIDYIVLHCTATPQNTTVASIQKYWKTPPPHGNGWKSPGYHFIIEADGTVHNLLPIEEVSNGVQGYNAHSIHISYIGGVDAKGKAVDNRTDAQKERQWQLVRTYKLMFPNAKVKGHRDFPGVKKECPSFDVASWLKEVGL